MTKFKNKCLRCEKAEAYVKGKSISAWCTKCHKEKFGCTHEERNILKPKKLPVFKIV